TIQAGTPVSVLGYGGGWNVATQGDNAVGILAQSIGGGGGNGGLAGSLALWVGAGLNAAVGGGGEGGGAASTATIFDGTATAGSNVLTLGDNAAGIKAQSIGGGGGNGGMSVALSAGSVGAVSVGV